jgi:prevent-host-death family protein
MLPLDSRTPLEPARSCEAFGRREARIAIPSVVQKGTYLYTPYMSTTETFNVTDARNQLATIIDLARSAHEPVYMTRRGRRIAAVIDAEDLDRILELAEDMADIRAAEAARAEMQATDETPIPWEQVKADLGLS